MVTSKSLRCQRCADYGIETYCKTWDDLHPAFLLEALNAADVLELAQRQARFTDPERVQVRDVGPALMPFGNRWGAGRPKKGVA